MEDKTGFDPEAYQDEYEALSKLKADLSRDVEISEVERQFWKGVLDDVESDRGFIIVA
jgi:hypothetical protein